MDKKHKWGAEDGVSLVEVLGATVILAVASLAMASFFINAMSYSKYNQSKTVMVNLARNALYTLENKEKGFDKLTAYFRAGQLAGANTAYPVLSMEGCTPEPLTCQDSSKEKLLKEMNLGRVLKPAINNVEYEVSVHFMADPSKGEEYEKLVSENPALTQYLLPVRIEVHDPLADPDSKRSRTVVEGYIADEYIR